MLGSAQPLSAPNAWINEFHYDNEGTDADEFIEVVVENATGYVLSAFQVVLYNGANGAVYDTKALDEFAASPVTYEDVFSFFTFEYPTNGIQNGAPDGMALCYEGALVPGQFISYEGRFEAEGGCADGVTSVDIGVRESGSTPEGHALQLAGEQKSTYDGFVWEEPSAATPGAPNTNQTLKRSRGGDATCPVGTERLAGYVWQDGSYVVETGDDVIEWEGDNSSASWAWASAGEEDGVAAVVVEGGTSNTVVYSPSATSGTVTDEDLAGAISNVQFCVPPGGCPQSYVVADDITREPSGSTPGQVTIVLRNDSDGIEQVDFIDENGDLFLENLVVSDPPAGFTADDPSALSWKYGGSGDAPRQVTFVLDQADIEQAYFRYFVRITTSCGSTFIDPPGVFEGPAERLALKGSYPNPSPGATTISFDLASPSEVHLVVYDVMGRKVATLVEQSMQAGRHEVHWDGRASDGRTVASGVYFYRLEAGPQVRTARIAIVR